MDYAYPLTKVVFKLIKDSSSRWNLKKNYPQAFFLPHMKPEEYSLFKELSRNKKVFLEYGSGGSTIYLLKNNKEVFSVESNPEFFDFMNSVGLVKRSLNKKLHYTFVDLGPTNKWGKPITSEQAIEWSAYYTKIWDSIDTNKQKVDVIFIDGRFRVSCCLYSILKVLEYKWADTIFTIHDFWRREQYHVVLKFLDEVKSSRNLASFKIKENINILEVQQMLQDHALVTQ